MSTNPAQHQRTKHIEIDICFVHDQVALGQVCVLHIPLFAHIFTKVLASLLFLNSWSSLTVRQSPGTTEESVR
jgi:hypothetical protein